MVFRYEDSLCAYRIADRRFPIFDGTGAALIGGRWNSPGHRVIYAGLSYACTMLEKLAQTGTGKIPKNQVWIEITLPQDVEVEEVTGVELKGWDRRDLLASRAYGDAWLLAQRTAALVVPSVVARQDRNILINQNHPDFKRITSSQPEPVIWDQRLFKM